MKTFQDWLQENNLNEISARLLNKAANVAAARQDPRGERLEDKFTQAANMKTNKEFEADPNKIVISKLQLRMVNVETRQDGSGWKIHCLDARRSPFTLFIDMPGRGQINRTMSVFLKDETSGRDYPVEAIERKYAMMISKRTGIRPTELPLA